MSLASRLRASDDKNKIQVSRLSFHCNQRSVIKMIMKTRKGKRREKCEAKEASMEMKRRNLSVLRCVGAIYIPTPREILVADLSRHQTGLP